MDMENWAINYCTAMNLRAISDYRKAYRLSKNPVRARQWVSHDYEVTPQEAMEEIEVYFSNVLGSLAKAFDCCLKLESDEDNGVPMSHYVPFGEDRYDGYC